MEIENSGVIGITETRTNTNAMKELYREEFKKIVEAEKKTDSNISRIKWKIKLGELGARIGLIFRPPSTAKTLTNLGTRAVSFITRKALTLKNKMDKNRFQKQKDKLTADFINGEGKFSEFYVVNQTSIEEITDEKEKGLSR